ncbi:MAG: hypothetical protein WCJ57_03380 [Candidatus Falkowbacteria bacterium]
MKKIVLFDCSRSLPVFNNGQSFGTIKYSRTIKKQTDMENNQENLDNSAAAAEAAAEKNLTEGKTGGLKSLVKLQTLLMFVGGLLIFGFVALYFSNSGMKELYKNQAGLATNVDVAALRDSFRIHAEEDSINFIAIGNDLTRHDEEIKALQKSSKNSNYSSLSKENKEIKSRLSVLESDFSNFIVSTNVTNVNNVTNTVSKNNTKTVKTKNPCAGLSEEDCETLMAELEAEAENAANEKETNSEENSAGNE